MTAVQAGRAARSPAHGADLGHAFVSYSRRDFAPVRAVVEQAEAAGRPMWMDTDDIRAGTVWRNELAAAIEQAGAVICFVSPAWAASEECRREVDHAITVGKRLIPVVLAPTDARAVPEQLRAVQWIETAGRSPAVVAEAVGAAIDFDADRVRDHTQLLVRAQRWERGRREQSRLLRGRELRAAEELVRDGGRDPHPTPLQHDFVIASRRGERRRLRTVVVAALVATLVASGLAVFAAVQWREAVQQRNTATSRSLAASAQAQLAVDPELSVMLARSAWQTAPTDQALTALQVALGTSRVRTTVPVGTAYLSGVVVTPDGSTGVSLDSAGTLRSFDLRSSTVVDSLAAGDGPGTLSADHSRTSGLVVGQDGRAVAWTLDPVTRRLGIRTRVQPVSVGAVSADGSRAVVVGTDGVIRESTGGGFVAAGTLPADESGAAAALSADGTTLVVGTGVDGADDSTMPSGAVYGRVHVYRADGSVGLLGEYETVVTRVSISDSGSTVLSEALDGTSRWQYARGLPVGTISTSSWVGAMDPSGSHVAIGSITGDLVLTSATGSRQLLLGGQPLADVRFSPDGSRLAAAGSDGVIRVWDTAGGTHLATMPAVVGATVAAWGDDSQWLVTGHVDGTVRRWGLPGPQISLPAGGTDVDPMGVDVSGLAFTPDGGRVVTVGAGLVESWNTADGSQDCIGGPAENGYCPITLHVGLTVGAQLLSADLAWRPDGSQFAILGSNGSVWTFDPGTGVATVARTDGDGAPVESGSVRYSPDGRLLVAQRGDRPPRLVDPDTGAVLATLDAPTSDGYAIAFPADGSGVLVTTTDGSVDLYGLDGRRVRHLADVGVGALAVAVSPHGDLVAVGSGPDIRLLAMSDGHLVATLSGHSGYVQALAFTADQGYLVSGSADTTVKVWNIPVGDLVDSVALPSGTAYSVAVTPDGRTIAAAGPAAAAYLLSCDVCLPGDRLADLAASRITREFTDQERVRFGLAAR